MPSLNWLRRESGSSCRGIVGESSHFHLAIKSIFTQFRALLIVLFFISLLFIPGYIRQLVVNDAPISGLILRIAISVSLVMASRWLTDFIGDREHFAIGWKRIF